MATSFATSRSYRIALGAGLLMLGAGLAFAQPRRRPVPRCDGPEIRVFKSRGRLELWCDGVQTESFAAAFGQNPVGPKVQEGDERTPEGDYVLTSHLTNARFFRFMGVSYPNAEDRARAARMGVTHLGHGIGIHGTQRSIALPARMWIRLSSATGLSRAWGPTDGCIALANEDVAALYEVVRVGTPVHIAP